MRTKTEVKQKGAHENNDYIFSTNENEMQLVINKNKNCG